MAFDNINQKTISFRITKLVYDDVIKICNKKSLMPGEVMRQLIREHLLPEIKEKAPSKTLGYKPSEEKINEPAKTLKKKEGPDELTRVKSGVKKREPKGNRESAEPNKETPKREPNWLAGVEGLTEF